MEGYKVELQPAYVWTCESCGRDNFVRGLVPEMDEDENAEMKAELGIESDAEGCWCQMPESVNCQHCGESFETEHYE